MAGRFESLKADVSLMEGRLKGGSLEGSCLEVALRKEGSTGDSRGRLS